MNLSKFFSVRFLTIFAWFCILIMRATSSFAQASDSTMVSNTTYTDSVATQQDVLSMTSQKPLISTAVDTAARFADFVINKPEVDKSATYKSATYYVMLFLLFCVFIAIVGKALQAYDLARHIQSGKAPFNWRRLQGSLFIFALLLGMYGVYWSYTVHGPMSIHESGSVHGERIDMMFKITLIITTIVFVLTHIALFAFAFKYRGTEGKKGYFYPHNNTLEKIWTIVPAIVLTVLVIFGFFTWRAITGVSEEDQKKALSIEVVGEQFKWSIRYAGADNQLGARNYKLISPTNGIGIDFNDKKSWDDKLAGEIVLPVNRPVRVTIGSKDILHSFYIPELRVQMNAVPGMPTYFQFTPRFTTAEMREKRDNPAFDYILLCAKICGMGHYNMQAKVRVVSEAEYQTWLAEQPLYYNDDVKKEMETQKASL